MVDLEKVAERAYHDDRSRVREDREPECYSCRRKAEEQARWFARAIAEELDPRRLGEILDDYGRMYFTGARDTARSTAIATIRGEISHGG